MSIYGESPLTAARFLEFFQERTPERVAVSRSYLLAYDLEDAADAIVHKENPDSLVTAKIIVLSDRITVSALPEQDQDGRLVESVFATPRAKECHFYQQTLMELYNCWLKTKSAKVDQVI